MKRILTAALLALSSSVFAATLNPIQLLNPAGSTSGQAIVSTGASTAPVWGNTTASGLVAQAANTVVANATGSTAAPTAFVMPTCTSPTRPVTWSAGVGFTCFSNVALTTSGLNQFAATTSAQLLGVISDETGSGALVFGTSPTIGTPTISGGTINSASVGATTPSTGAFTTLAANSTVSGTGFSNYLAAPPAIGGTTPNTGKFSQLQATSFITPATTAGLVGTTLGDSVVAGSVGEYASATGSAVALTTATPANCTSLPLTAGDWDVYGSIIFNGAGTTSTSVYMTGISTTSATLPSGPDLGEFFVGSSGTNTAVSVAVPQMRENFSSSTTVFLVAQATFTTSTETATCKLQARRRR